MAIVQSDFSRIAEAVTEKTADLLSTDVQVVDERDIVVASSNPNLIGLPFQPAANELSGGCLQVPLRLEGQQGRVVLTRQGEGEHIPDHLAQVLVDLVINQAAVVHRLPNKNELKNKLIHNLLHGLIDEEGSILREAEILGMDLGPPRAVILIDAADYIHGPEGSARFDPSDPHVARQTQIVIGSVVDFFELPNDTICAYIGNGEVAVLKASNKQSLRKWVQEDEDTHASNLSNPSWAHLAGLKHAGADLLARLRSNTGATMSVGIGRHHPGLDGLGRSYQDARAALSLGLRFQGQNQVHCLDSLGIAAFVGVSDERTKIELATYLLSPLDHEPELLKTLSAFFASNFSPSQAARQLSIHRNTLSYRLDKIMSLTGLDPRRFDDAIQIRLALVLRALAHEPEAIEA